MTDEQAVCIADTVPSRHVFFSCAYESSSSCGDCSCISFGLKRECV